MECNTLYRRSWRDAPDGELKILMAEICVSKIKQAAFRAEFTSRADRRKWMWETFDVMYLKNLATLNFGKRLNAMSEQYHQSVRFFTYTVSVCVAVDSLRHV